MAEDDVMEVDTMVLHRKNMERRVYDRCHGAFTPTAMYNIGVGGGTEAWTLLEKWPGMKVYGVEPSPLQFAALQGKYPGQTVNAAVLDRIGECTLYEGPVGSGYSSVGYGIGNGRMGVTVPCTTLDFLDALWKKPERVLLWMDIEGSELMALKGATELLKSGRCGWISLEARNERPPGTPDWYPTEVDIMLYLRSLRYVHVESYNNQGTHWDMLFRRLD